MSYIDELNESQRAAVIYNDGPSLIVAGAGSGKTRVLTCKIAYLIENGYQPRNILALTFTNKAAREMKERIARQVGEECSNYLWMGTFHSIFLRILHAEANRLGFTSQFTIYDSSDSKSLIHSIIKELALDDKVYKDSAIQNRISNAKNRLITPKTYASTPDYIEADKDARIPRLSEIYGIYWNRMRQANAMDFDDLLIYTYMLFKHFPEVLERYQQQFHYILVDEYQDTNFAQHQIVLQLAQQHHHVCVVGDDAQSIYSFRGADIDNILYFTKIFPEAKLFKLEQNYRSTQVIVNAANSLIEKNKRQIHKAVFSKNEEGERIDVKESYSDTEEAEIVAGRIHTLMRSEGLEGKDFAILYRTNAQSRSFEEVFRKRMLSYRIYGGLSFYQRKEVKDIIAYFRLVVNPDDEEALKRIINYPTRGIGNTTLDKISQAATEKGVSLWTVLCNPIAYGLKINQGTHTKLQQFQALITRFIQLFATQDAYELGSAIIRGTGIVTDVMADNSPESISRKENIEELVNGINTFCQQRREEGNMNVTLSDYLAEVSLLTDQDSDKEDDTHKITLMTIHAAKGLEFPVVFVVGLEENLFPNAISIESPRELEEERRLFYVAITRAQKHLFLTYAKSRFRYGKMEFSAPSRFLKDIDMRYLNWDMNQAITSTRRMPSLWDDDKPTDYSSRTSSFRESGYRSESGYRHEVNYQQPSRRFSSSPEPPHYTTQRPQQVTSNFTRLPKFTNTTTANKPATETAKNIPAVGQLIEHERFGIGEVLKVEGTGENTKATIQFQNAGQKQLLLRFARFKIIG